jgi:phenylacetate-CoA ligase
MVKVKGVNIYPGQIDELLKTIAGVSSEYLATVDHRDGKDRVELAFEIQEGFNKAGVEEEVKRQFKSRVGLSIIPVAGVIGSLPRSEKKSVRIVDRRFS